MTKFIAKQILQPFAGKWLRGFSLLALWTLAFIALPAISGWFLAACSVAFVTVNIAFSYLIPSAAIRLLAIFRTALRYFERLENHKTTLAAQQKLQLKIFQSVAKFSYFNKQVNNNAGLLENSTVGVDKILNHILLWLLPLSSLIVAVVLYFTFISVFSSVIAIEFLISSAFLLFVVPQFVFYKNTKLYNELKSFHEENNQLLIQSFRGQIEITKYNLESKAISQYEERLEHIEKLEKKLQNNSFYLQLIAGFGFSCIATFLIWHTSQFDFNAELAIGVFFGIMAQAELAEILFAGKSDKSAVSQYIKEIDQIYKQGDLSEEPKPKYDDFESLSLVNVSAKIPETYVYTDEISIEISKGDWIAIYGETGKGKTTFLNSLFYPEYHLNGSMIWNSDKTIAGLPVPQAVYVTQKAYLLTGTIRENFEGYADNAIEQVLNIVDLASWYTQLPEKLNSWLGENGEILSGGQRKKMLLAQALLKNPQLLVVDEPTAGISTENAIEIFQSIKKNYPQMTILMATHLTDFENVVDKVVRL